MKDIITRSFRMLTRNIINFNCSVAYKINVMMDSFDLNGSKSFELAGYPAATNVPDSRAVDFEAILNEIFLFAAPKKKVSPGKKRRKHLRFIPDKVQWNTCQRCGEPKLPHRLCKKNMSLCAMREEDYEAYIKNRPQD